MSWIWTIVVDQDIDGWERLLGDALVAYIMEGGDLADVRVEFSRHEDATPTNQEEPSDA